MTKLLCVFGLLITVVVINVQADDIEVRRTRFANPELEKETSLSNDAQIGLKAWISIAKCEFVEGFTKFDSSKQRPNVFLTQSPPCETSKVSENSFYCSGKVVCETEELRMTIRDVICHSKAQFECPDARACALATDLPRSKHLEHAEGKKQQASVWMNKGGWDIAKKQTYVWSPDDEKELKDNFEKSSDEKQTP